MPSEFNAISLYDTNVPSRSNINELKYLVSMLDICVDTLLLSDDDGDTTRIIASSLVVDLVNMHLYVELRNLVKNVTDEVLGSIITFSLRNCRLCVSPFNLYCGAGNNGCVKKFPKSFELKVTNALPRAN